MTDAMTSAGEQRVEVVTDRIGARWPELAALLAGQTLASLTTAVISVAAPQVGQHLGLTHGELQLVVSAFGLAYTALLVTGARLGDRGYRQVFLAGVALFTAAGLVSGLAPGVGTLTVGQLLQGAGAALMVPQILSLIQLRFAGPARSRAIGLYSMTLGYGVAIGLVLGGLLAGSDVLGLTWRPAFLINVPVGVVLLLAGWAWLPAGDSGRRSSLDLRGVVVLTAAMAFTIIGLTFGPAVGWPLWTWACVLVGIVTFTCFVFLELRLGGRDPLLDFRVLRDFGVVPGLVVVLVLMGGYGTLLYTMSAYLQDGLGYGVLHSGLVFAAYAMGFGTVNLTWTRLPRATHRWVSPVGIAALCVAEFLLAALLGTHLDLAAVLPLLVIGGAGHGTGFGALVDRIAAHTPPERGSALSGLINTVTQLAIVIGIAVIGGLYLSAAGSGGPAGHASAIGTVCVVLGVLGLVALACSLFVSIRLPDPARDAARPVH